MGFFNHLFDLDKFDASPSQKPASMFPPSGLELDEKTVALVLAEIDVDTALAAHEDWKQQLQDVLDGHSGNKLFVEVTCRDDYCDLGKWLHGAGVERFAQYPAFNALLSRHQYFHAEAARVLAQVREGDTKKAQETLHGSYRQASVQVVLLLKELKRGLRH